MLVTRRIQFTSCIAALALTIACATASAAPVTVKLRVEGSTNTLFEGEVTTQGETFEGEPGKGSHPCDYADNGNHEGFTNGGNPSGTPTTALRDAALSVGLPFEAKWSESLGDFFVTQVGSDVEETTEPFDAWGFAVNYTTAPVGGCQIALAPGSEVLWAYNYFNLKHLLSLTGPATVNLGTPFTVHVTDGQTGQPIDGAQIGQFAGGVTASNGSSPTTDANGNATVVISQAGTETLKATQAESVRSNGLTVCVHNGNDGSCGTPPPPVKGGSEVISSPVPKPLPAIVRVGGVHSGRRYSRRSAPRVLTGSVEVPLGATLHEVRLSLQRVSHGHCFVLDGTRAAFAHAKCHAQRFFKVADTTSFSYLLPSRLPAGRYVYAVEVVNDSGVVTKPAQGVSRVVFYVK